MNIRTRLTLRFIGIVAVITFLMSALIYVFSSDYREEDFYTRLSNKANNTAKILIEVDEVDAELLSRIERDNPVNLPNERIIVYDFRNDVIFSLDEEKAIHTDKNLLDRIRLEEEIRFRQGDYEVLGFLFKSKYDRFVVIAAAQDIYGFRKLSNLRTILLGVFAASIVIVSISGWIFAGKALKPISKVVNQVDEITITSLNRRVDEGNGKDEIAQLSRTFNSMLKRLENSFLLQKNFIANASHELRTPLTSITGQLEVTLLNSRTNEEYCNVLRSVLEDIKNLNNLSNRLLLLAQAEGTQGKMAALRIDELLWQIRDELLKHNSSHQININIGKQLDDPESLTVEGDEQLIKTALLNVIENGCKYSRDQAVEVLIDLSRNNLIIYIKDKGVGISGADMKNIFEPFYRGTNTVNVKGHGIGLSIVKPIIKLHRGTIHIDSILNMGTTVEIVLPLLKTENKS